MGALVPLRRTEMLVEKLPVVENEESFEPKALEYLEQHRLENGSPHNFNLESHAPSAHGTMTMGPKTLNTRPPSHSSLPFFKVYFNVFVTSVPNCMVWSISCHTAILRKLVTACLINLLRRSWNFQIPNNKSNQRKVELQIWTTFPESLDRSVLYVHQEIFNFLFATHCLRTKDDPQIAFLAVRSTDSIPEKFRLVAVQPASFTPASETKSETSDAIEESEETKCVLYGELWTTQNLLLPVGVCLSAFVIEPITLSRVIIAVRCPGTREELERALNEKKVLHECCRKSVIISQGNNFYIPNSDAVVLHCEPVLQGLLGFNTEIVVAEFLQHGRCARSCGSSAGHSDSRASFSMSGNLSLPDTSSVRNLELYEQAVRLATSFVGPLQKPIRKLALGASQALLKLAAEKIKSRQRLNISVLTKPLKSVLVGLDENNTGFVSRSVLERLSPPTEDANTLWFWSTLIISRNETKLPTRRMIQLVSVEKISKECEAPENEILINPALWFNLNHHPSALVQENVSLELSPIAAKDLPGYFHTVRFSCIRSPGFVSEDSDRWYPFLERHFSTSRLVKVGDVICLPLGFYAPSGSLKKSVFFMVSHTEPEGMECGLVQRSRTFLFLGGYVNSFVPATMDSFLQTKPWNPLWDQPFPVVFGSYVAEILATFAAYASRKLSPAVLLYGDSGFGKQIIINSIAAQLNLQVVEINVIRDILADTAAAMEAKIQQKFEKAADLAPEIVVLRHLEYFVKGKQEPRIWQALQVAIQSLLSSAKRFPVYLIGTCSCEPFFQLEDIFPVCIRMKGLCELDRLLLMQELAQSHQTSMAGLDMRGISTVTSGFNLSDIIALLEATEVEAFRRVKQICFPDRRTLTAAMEETIRASGISFLQRDLENALSKLHHVHASNFGLPNIPRIQWEDIGGLEDAKREILRTIQLPLECAQIISSGFQRFGVLLCGPPGNGKTLLAKAVASQCSLNFISVKGPELINMYVGQSEENVRAVFERARNASPCVIFFDEVDSLAPNRGRSGDSGGVIDRVVSQLMIEMDGLADHKQVFVFGATNRPDLLDPALLRPGRFDCIIQIDNPSTADARLKILQAVTRKCTLSPSCDLTEVERHLPAGLSGADLYAVCANAVLNSIKRLVDEGRTDNDPVVSLEDFVYQKEYITCE